MSKLEKFEVSFKDINNQKIKLTKLAKEKVRIKKIIDDIESLDYTDEQLEETALILSSVLDRINGEYGDSQEICNYFDSNKNFRDFKTMKKWLNNFFDKLVNNVYVLATHRRNEEERRHSYKILLKGFRFIADILEDANLEPIQMISILNTIANLDGVCVSGWKEAVMEILTKLEKQALEKTNCDEYESDPMKRVLKRTFWDARVSVTKELGYKYMDKESVPTGVRPHYMDIFYRYFNKVHKLNLPIVDLSDKLYSTAEKMEIALKFGVDNLNKHISIHEMIYDRAIDIFNDEIKQEGNFYDILSTWGSSYFRRNGLSDVITDNVEFLTDYVLNDDMTKVRTIAIKEIMKDYGYISEKKSIGLLKRNRPEVCQRRFILALNDIKTDNEKENLRKYILDERTDLEKMFKAAVKTGYYSIFDYIKDVDLYKIDTKIIKQIKKNAWFEAIKHGNIDNIKRMLKLGVDVNERDANKSTALYIACCANQYDVADFLIKNGANVNLECQYKKTPLYIAFKNKNHELIELLLNNDARIILGKVSFMHDSLEMYGILCTVCSKRYVRVLRQLIDSKINLDMQPYSFERESILHRMVRKGDLEMVRILLKEGASVNIQDEGLRTPLHIACIKGNVDMVRCLLKAGSDVNITDEELETPLHCACKNGNSDIVELLIKAKAKINVSTREGDTPIYIATYNGHLDVVKKLLENGANLKSRYNGTILYRACKNGYLDIAKILQQNGAVVNNRTTQMYAYKVATKSKNMDALNILIDAGVNLNIKDAAGWTALYRVCQQEDIRTLKVLLRSNTLDINIKCGKERKTALDVAVKKRSIYIQEMLRRYQKRTGSTSDITRLKVRWSDLRLG